MYTYTQPANIADMKTTVKQTRRNLFIPDHLWAEAGEFASRKDITTSDVVRTALQKYLEAVKRAQEAAKHGQ